MLKLLHENHFGIVKTKARARELLYWPGISVDIENLVANCIQCNKYMNAQAKESLTSHEIPDLPYNKIALDIAEIGPNIYLVVVDYLSKWVDVVKLKSKTTSDVVQGLKPIFATHGIPMQVVGDNNPFGSYEFKEFGKEWGFDVVNSSPMYPRSNGQVERTIQTIKKILKKCIESHQDIQIALLEYRNTPVIDNLSPAQILSNRRLRTKIPVVNKLLRPETCNTGKVKEVLLNRQNKSAKNYNKTTKPKEHFKVRDLVYVYNVHKRIWEPGEVVGYAQTPRSYIVKLVSTGSVLRRNSFHLRRRSSYLGNSCKPNDFANNVFFESQGCQSCVSVPNTDHDIQSNEKRLIVTDEALNESFLNVLNTPYSSHSYTGSSQSNDQSVISSPFDTNTDGNSPNKTGNTSVSPQNNSPMSTSPIGNPSQFKTRLGRMVRKPDRFKDFV